MTAEHSRLQVKVVPRARRDEIVGWLGERLKVKIAAPPEGGRANEALAHLLAEVLGVPQRRVRIVAGHASPSKVVEIEGLAQTDLIGRLSVGLRAS